MSIRVPVIDFPFSRYDALVAPCPAPERALASLESRPTYNLRYVHEMDDARTTSIALSVGDVVAVWGQDIDGGDPEVECDLMELWYATILRLYVQEGKVTPTVWMKVKWLYRSVDLVDAGVCGRLISNAMLPTELVDTDHRSVINACFVHSVVRVERLRNTTVLEDHDALLTRWSVRVKFATMPDGTREAVSVVLVVCSVFLATDALIDYGLHRSDGFPAVLDYARRVRVKRDIHRSLIVETSPA
ncbi:hypothetical protein L210DRAFT_986257 [Boletus edulis BED1]|uniref:Uncharacterized protein n=1 Tax=Boletus edulis BED1 TaxID=1328754 RepID=A0AAD4BPI8_BOLED|nr:hypothetical protein L210DRAFT_986257 [Boletus edulis BED1]